MSQPTSIGELIRERRLAHGMSLSQFATRLGIPPAEVRAWERGEKEPLPISRGTIAEILEIDPDVLDAAWPTERPATEDETVPPEPAAPDAGDTDDTHLAAGGVVAAAAAAPQPGQPSATPPPYAEVATMTDEPTQAVGAPFVMAEPAETEALLVTVAEPETPKRRNPLRYVYDPDRPWIYYLRGTLTVVILGLLGLALVRLVPQLLDALGELLDTIQTEADLRSEIQDVDTS